MKRLVVVLTDEEFRIVEEDVKKGGYPNIVSWVRACFGIKGRKPGRPKKPTPG